MIPNPNEVSAFAVYSGLVGASKSRKKRDKIKMKQQKTKVADRINLGKSNSKASGKTINVNPKMKKDSAGKKSKNKAGVINNDSTNILDVTVHDTDLPSVRIGKNNEYVEQSPEIKTGKRVKPKDKSISLNQITEIVKPKDGKKRKMNGAESKKKSRGNSFTDEAGDNEDLQKSVESSFNVSLNLEDEVMNDINPSSIDNGITNKKRKRDKFKKDRPSPEERKRLLKDEVKKMMKGKSSSSSIIKGKTVLESLISPFKAEEFFSEYWEKKPLFINRGGDNPMFSQYLSTAEMDEMLRYNMLLFGRNVDVTTYCDGVRETHNPEGRAHPHIVWDYYSNGCSVRILNPQTYLNKIHTLLAALQEYFGCFVGSNIYLTPANTQGFAPHYDDIEAFVLQVEGAKHWRVYQPRSSFEELPRYSSKNFSQDEIGSPILDVVLRPGDLLYFPRGFIHQAEALPDQHSLHITVSTYQKTTWLDLIEKALPVALARASEENIDYRRGLPIGYLRSAGLAHPTGSLRGQLIAKLKKLIFYLEKHLDMDDAVDKLGISFVHQSLPPILSQDESECSVHNGGLKIYDGKLTNRVGLTLETGIRWIRANAFRIVEDSEVLGQARLYHSIDNSKEYLGEDVQYSIVDKEMLPALIHLVKSYPSYISVSELPCQSDDEKLLLAGDLWDRGLLVSNSPLEPIEEDS